MSNDKTHYRKAFASPYLSAADVVEPTRLTIAYVRLEGDKTKKTKTQMNTAYFAEREIRKGEKLKPMILNATNSKMMAKMTGSPFIEDWVNVPVEVYAVSGVRFGNETVEGLRIKPAAYNPPFNVAAALESIASAPDYQTARQIATNAWRVANQDEQDQLAAAIRNRPDNPDNQAAS